MGCHINPQFYLRGFAQQGSPLLWVYEKGNDKPRPLPIKRIAQEKHFYSENIERYLADNIEMPANHVLQKIRDQEPISPNDKETLSEYIFIFYKRVPRALQRFHTAAPSIANDLMKKININLDQLRCSHSDKSDLYESLRVKAQKIINGYKESPPKEGWQNSIPIKDLNPVKLLSRMNWVFLTCKEPDLFITCDNPVFIHAAMGINKVRSELTFPISKNISLFANWWNMKDLSYIEANSSLIKEMNRRMAFNATRFMYCHIHRDWVTKLLNKKSPLIHLIALPRIDKNH